MSVLIHESAVETALVDRAALGGWACYKLSFPGRRGAPDRLLVSPRGDILFVETKRGRLGELSPHQVDIRLELTSRGARYYVIRKVEEIDAILRQFE